MGKSRTGEMKMRAKVREWKMENGKWERQENGELGILGISDADVSTDIAQSRSRRPQPSQALKPLSARTFQPPLSVDQSENTIPMMKKVTMTSINNPFTQTDGIFTNRPPNTPASRNPWNRVNEVLDNASSRFGLQKTFLVTQPVWHTSETESSKWESGSTEEIGGQENQRDNQSASLLFDLKKEAGTKVEGKSERRRMKMENREWEKAKNKEELSLLSRPQNQSGKKQNSDHQQSIGNGGTGEKILSIHLSAPSNLLLSDNQRVMSNPTIPKGKLISSNVLYSLTDETPKKPGATSNNPNHPEVKLTDKSANTSRTVLAETNLMRSNLTNNRTAVNGFMKGKIEDGEDGVKS